MVDQAGACARRAPGKGEVRDASGKMADQAGGTGWQL